MGSCAALAGRSRLASFEEVAISTGKKHGAFYQRLPEWVGPLAGLDPKRPIADRGSPR